MAYIRMYAALSDEHVNNNDQWDLAKKLLAPLQQIVVATVYFSEKSKVSISSVLPICMASWIIYVAVADENSSIVKTFKETVVSSIK